MEFLHFTRDIPVKYRADIAVIGGGPAGVAAALTAARARARVFAADAAGCFGGMGTSGLIPAFMQFSDGERFLAGGVGEEIFAALGGVKQGKCGLSIDAERLKRVYDGLMAHPNITASFFTTLSAVEADNGQIRHAVFTAKSGLFAVEAAVFLDCTGDGDLCAYAGASYEMGEVMASTLCSAWAGIDWDRVRGSDDRFIREAVEAGVISQVDYHLPGMWRTGERTGGGNIGHVFGVDGTDERSLTAAMIEGRRRVLEYEKYYKEYLTGYEEMTLTATAPVLGVRESRRILGDYMLNLEDFQNRAVFADEIGRYAYPVDIHAGSATADAYESYKDRFGSGRGDGRGQAVEQDRRGRKHYFNRGVI